MPITIGLVVVLSLLTLHQQFWLGTGLLQNMCNKDNYKNMDGWLVKQMRRAKAELSFPSSPMDDFDMDCMVDVFRFNQVARCYVVNHKTQCYVPILKNAHVSIEDNMNVVVKMNDGDQVVLHRLLGIQGETQPNFPTFTFARDPLSHFESGFAEAVLGQDLAKMGYYSAHRPLGLSWNYDVHHQTLDHVEMILNNFFTFNKRADPLYTKEHFFTQSGVLGMYDIDKVGAVEMFEEDWGIIFGFWGANYTFNHKLGSHANSNSGVGGQKASDPKRAREFLNKLYEVKPQYLRAVCEYVLIDYVCLPKYELPKGCEHLQGELDLGRMLLKSSVDPAIAEAKISGVKDALAATPAHLLRYKQGDEKVSFFTLEPSTPEDTQEQLQARSKRPNKKCHGGGYNGFYKNMPIFLATQALKCITELNDHSFDSNRKYFANKMDSHTRSFRSLFGMKLYPAGSPYFPGVKSDIAYAHIANAASTAIQANILASITPFQEGLDNSAIRYRTLFTNSSYYFTTSRNYQVQSHSHGLKQAKKPLHMFTFVRDPYDRFLDAFAETIYDAWYYVDFDEAHINQTLFDFFVEGGLKNPFLTNGANMNTMSGGLFEWDVDIIGKVEDIKSDWENMIVPAYGLNDKLPWNSNFGRRNHTFNGRMAITDEKEENKGVPMPVLTDVRKELEIFLMKNQKYHRAVCHYLLIDYVCLEDYYHPPAQCIEMEGELNKARAMLNKGRQHTMP